MRKNRKGRWACGAGLAALLFVAGAAGAEQPARIAPARDVAVTYRLATPVGPKGDAEIRDLRLSRRVGGTTRVDLLGAEWRLVVDGERQAFAVDDARRTVADVPLNLATAFALPEGAFEAPGLAWRRVGPATVAGQACTDWLMAGGQLNGAVACLADDGVLLRLVTPEGARLDAVAVAYGPLAGSLFAAPDGHARTRAGALGLPAAAVVSGPGKPDRPDRVTPARDVDVAFAVTDGAVAADAPKQVLQVRQRANGGPARADILGAHWWAVLDKRGRQAFAVFDARRTMLALPDAAPLVPVLPGAVLDDPGLGWVRVGQAPVAGRACVNWIVTVAGRVADGLGVVCLDGDGLLLRAVPADAPRLEAAGVAFGPLPDSLFAAPAGYAPDTSRPARFKAMPLPGR